MKILLAVLATAIAFFVMLYLLQTRENKRNVMVRRMEFFSSNKAAAAQGGIEVQDGTLQERLMEKVRAIATHWRKVHQNADLDLKMQQADWPLLGSEFQVLLALGSVAAGAFALLLTFVQDRNDLVFILIVFFFSKNLVEQSG